MSIILKHILRNIEEKKLMSVLIVFSLAISGALLLVALSISEILDKVAGNEFDSASTVFLLIFIVTLFMSVFVVYSSFKYIMALRIRTIGTFRSVGADKSKSRNLLLLESLAYGLISAVIAVAIGIALLAVLSAQLSGGKAQLTLSFVNIIITIAFCTLLSPICAYLPIKASEKFSVKEIILQTGTVQEKHRLPYLFIGLILIIVGLSFMMVPDLKYEEIFIILSLLFILAGCVMSAGPLIYYFFAFLQAVFKNNFTPKNLKNSRAYSNIGVLIAIAVGVIFMINGSNEILVKATDDSFKLYNYQIQINAEGINSAVISQIKETEQNTAGVYLETQVEVRGQIPIMNLYGMDTIGTNTNRTEFFNFTTLVIEDPVPANPILLSSDYLSRRSLKVGDTVEIGGTEFTIYGILAEMLNNGNVGVIPESHFIELYGTESSMDYTMAVIKTETPAETAQALRTSLPETMHATTVAEMLVKVKSINSDLFTVLNYLMVLSTVAGIFGVLNNLLIAFNSQKRERALLRSLGMSKNTSSRLIVSESLITGLLGGLLGILGGILLVMTIPAVIVVFEFPAVAMPFVWLPALICVGCSVLICGLASLISLIGNSKLNIVKTLREEVL